MASRNHSFVLDCMGEEIRFDSIIEIYDGSEPTITCEVSFHAGPCVSQISFGNLTPNKLREFANSLEKEIIRTQIEHENVDRDKAETPLLSRFVSDRERVYYTGEVAAIGE